MFINKNQSNPLVGAETVRHPSNYIISYRVFQTLWLCGFMALRQKYNKCYYSLRYYTTVGHYHQNDRTTQNTCVVLSKLRMIHDTEIGQKETAISGHALNMK